MIVKPYFSYVRVSTLRQGQTGTSLAEQQFAIGRYADRAGLTIVKEYEEKETAAKSGRPIFNQMLAALKAGKARGVIIHKIDRSARNLQDWVHLQELTDNGVEIHFANESIDLQSRGGRLSADIQAVVAADYIRNLREETRKGFYGRLKQGLYPRPAPPGYLDCGKGQPKAIDPVKGPLVKQAFELYATGHWGLIQLTEHLKDLGLRGKQNKPITLNGLSTVLHNTFYCGLISIKLTGEIYEGKHKPLVSKQLFDCVQNILNGKLVERHQRHNFLWRRLITCTSCGKHLIGEERKHHRYYRCHTKGCVQKSMRERAIDEQFNVILKQLRFSNLENEQVRAELKAAYSNVARVAETQTRAIQLQLAQLEMRLNKLADLYIDGMIEKEIYIQKKNDLLLQQAESRDKLKNINTNEQQVLLRVEKFVGLVNNAYKSYKLADTDDKREMIKIIMSDATVDGESLIFKLRFPFQMVVEHHTFTGGSPQRGVPRTLSALVSQLTQYFASR